MEGRSWGLARLQNSGRTLSRAPPDRGRSDRTSPLSRRAPEAGTSPALWDRAALHTYSRAVFKMRLKIDLV